ncbi:LysE family translocator [Niallia sp. 01092]|uniref:LysE family translocator n=1 Tax=unclassified Niallia TaxID=2837522 RepID=UPI003FD6216C
MPIELWVSFIIASILIISAPGPAVTFLITTSINDGKRNALSIIPGVFLGDLVAMILSFAGVGAIIVSSPTAFLTLKIIGALYLIYLGVKIWIESKGKSKRLDHNNNTHEQKKSFIKGFWISVLNPKSIIFFAAFIPQFISNEYSYIHQITILGATYLFIGVLNDVAYTVLAHKISKFLKERIVMWVIRIGALNLIITGFILTFLK